MDYETAQDLFDALSAPFSSESIDWRVGSTNAEKTKGMALAYIDARTVMDRLDAICGPDGWQCNYGTVNGSAVCNLGVRMPKGEWLWKADGAGQTDFEGEKGALSDALKRAAVRWGIGRYLYGMGSPWVKIEQKGKSYVIQKDELTGLSELHEKEAQKVGWGGPADIATYRFLARVVEQTVTDAASAMDFREKNKGMFQLLRVRARNHLNNLLDRAGAPQEEAA